MATTSSRGTAFIGPMTNQQRNSLAYFALYTYSFALHTVADYFHYPIICRHWRSVARTSGGTASAAICRAVSMFLFNGWQRVDDTWNRRLRWARFSECGGTFNVPANITDEADRNICHARREGLSSPKGGSPWRRTVTRPTVATDFDSNKGNMNVFTR